MNQFPSDLHPQLLRGITDCGFTEPTPIQRQALPAGLEGRDILACAMTGSGKTAAFLLPILQRMLDAPFGSHGKASRRETRALVLAPTRELAAQIVESFRDLARHTNLKAAAVHGGVSFGPQEQAFRRGVDLIVACPGRLLDHFQHGYARLSGLEVLVLDEADRMLDMGFLPDIRRVLKHLPEVQQTLLFSATMPRPIAELSRQLLHDPVKIDIDRPSAPAKGVEQSIYPVPQTLKQQLLLALLDQGEIDNVLVFTRTKHRANRLAKFLNGRGHAADRIHGNRTQAQRTKALAAFKNGETRILVATDIAARGIDVDSLSHVINFDVPNVPEDYIHRVGRTARAQATGEAFTFVSDQEMSELRAIERAVGKKLPRKQLDGFSYDAPPPQSQDHVSQGQGHRTSPNRRTASHRPAAGRPAGQGSGRPRRRRARGGGR